VLYKNIKSAAGGRNEEHTVLRRGKKREENVFLCLILRLKWWVETRYFLMGLSNKMKIQKVKRLIKGILLIALGSGIILIIYAFEEGINAFENMSKPHITSDYETRTLIKSQIGSLPDSSHHLYCASKGFQDAEYFIAFTASPSDCNAFLQKYKGISIDSFKRITSLPEKLVKRGPESWDEEYQDSNWDLSKQREILVYGKDEKTALFYSPKQSRLFICIWWI